MFKQAPSRLLARSIGAPLVVAGMVAGIIAGGARLAGAGGPPKAAPQAPAAHAPPAASQPTPAAALERLMEGNKRYVSGKLTQVSSDHAGARKALGASQSPFAIVLACADSRVSPELLFDQGLGQLFVVRVAGNVAAPVVLGSIEYAAEHLHTPLVLVVGHERCGAVRATIESGGKAEGNIGSLVSEIAPGMADAEKTCPACKGQKACATGKTAELVECLVSTNAQHVAAALTERSPVLKALVAEGKLKIAAGRYDLDDGVVTLLP